MQKANAVVNLISDCPWEKVFFDNLKSLMLYKENKITFVFEKLLYITKSLTHFCKRHVDF